MPPLNWPPAGVATPPFQCSGIVAARFLKGSQGWDWRDPTTAERTAWFTPARCSRDHTVTGIVVVGPDGTLYPLALCDAPADEKRHFLILWDGPYFEYPEP